MQNMIHSIKKKNAENKLLPLTSINSKTLSSIHPTIASSIGISHEKPAYFSSFFSTHAESKYHSLYYLKNEEIALKEGFNTSL